ncbi:hypothetical protein HZH68_014098 [Vespula germanica]|uniref:Uncharacterized protein n=1 Tax=Vespula germanica TaxID=30212 RepID=A0A834J9K9_VESGE|nr:hypothetical protein HZH68_014098 [Vespula germanica]
MILGWGLWARGKACKLTCRNEFSLDPRAKSQSRTVITRVMEVWWSKDQWRGEGVGDWIEGVERNERVDTTFPKEVTQQNFKQLTPASAIATAAAAAVIAVTAASLVQR